MAKTSGVAAPAPARVPAPGIAVIVAAKAHSVRHRAEIEASTRCACFFCFRVFPSAEIKAWTDVNTTALCPKCGVDAVIGDASGHSIAERSLRKMHEHYFAYRSK
jgi:hypothetical protein